MKLYICYSLVNVSGLYLGVPGESPNQEWVQVTNQGTTAVNLQDWKITDEGAKHTSVFSSYTLNSTSTVTLYSGSGTNTANTLYWNKEAFIWNNEEGDTAYLYNAQGKLVSTKSTTTQKSTDAQKSTPTITWSKPADITYGTVLSSAQLNAVSSIPGTFKYTPDSGALLTVGLQTLSVVFTPIDTATYNTASQFVTINVLPAATLSAPVTTVTTVPATPVTTPPTPVTTVTTPPVTVTADSKPIDSEKINNENLEDSKQVDSEKINNENLEEFKQVDSEKINHENLEEFKQVDSENVNHENLEEFKQMTRTTVNKHNQ